MNERTYNPAPQSVAWRVRSYFIQQPEEELSDADISLKFECSLASVKTLLKPAVDAGLLTREARVYGPGATLAAWHARMEARKAEAVTAAKKVAAKRETKMPAAHLPELDIDSLPPVEADVPVPGSNQSMRRGRTKYDSLFATLTEIGHSRLVPAHYCDAIKKAAAIRKKYHGEAYVLMRVDPQMARIWRVEPKARKGAQAANDAAERSAA